MVWETTSLKKLQSKVRLLLLNVGPISITANLIPMAHKRSVLEMFLDEKGEIGG
jgi:hypothetical protein